MNNLAFNSFSVGGSPSSFGMIVNKGWINKDGIASPIKPCQKMPLKIKFIKDDDEGILTYCEEEDAEKFYFQQILTARFSWGSNIYMVLPSGYSYVIDSSVNPIGITVFDELVAYSADTGKVCRNGQGVVSIHTGTITMTGGSEKANTYAVQTTLGKKQANQNTRYYYNLDTIAKSAESDSDKLMNWALYRYAAANIRDNFSAPFSAAIPNGTYDMQGYSWYPVDVDSNLEVNGTFSFYNAQIEKEIENRDDTKYSTLSDSQHYLIPVGGYVGVIVNGGLYFRNMTSGNVNGLPNDKTQKVGNDSGNRSDRNSRRA